MTDPVIVNRQIVALQRAIRDLQRERKRWETDRDPGSSAYKAGAIEGLTFAIYTNRDHIKRLRARAAKGAGT